MCVCVFHCMITKFQGGIVWGTNREIFKRKKSIKVLIEGRWQSESLAFQVLNKFISLFIAISFIFDAP